jgi:membrane protease YdiL (CAAX protease family)
MLQAMNLTDSLLPADLLFFAYFVWLLIAIAGPANAAPWRTFLADSRIQQVFLGASFALFLMWIFEVGVRPALGFISWV